MVTKRRYFGTDGIRGRVGQAPILPDFVMRLGLAAGQVLAQGQKRPTVLIGKDTRISGYMLESALEAGFSAAGVDVLLTGPLPTPGIAYLTRALRLQAGVVISASHNPFDDNGIKFFSADGTKLDDTVELAIEEKLYGFEQTSDSPFKLNSRQLGKVRRIDDARGRYIEFCKSTFPNKLNLRGLKIVVDCANGAGYHIAPDVFHELGADVVAIGASPDGFNINQQVGATAPQKLQAAVISEQADMGIALDGDGDRLLMVDHQGNCLDGDQLLAIIVMGEQQRHHHVAGVVGTLMTNLAMEKAMLARGVAFARSKVGDRYVLQMLNEKGWRYGGENSGHIICLDHHSTGDGIIAALQVLSALAELNSNLASMRQKLPLFPQILKNVPITNKFDWQKSTVILSAVAEAERQLADKGRILIRPSGTEPLLRVMVEGEQAQLVTQLSQQLSDAVQAAVAAD